MSLNAREMLISERASFLAAVQLMLDREALSLGEALRVLRAAYLGLSRARFAQLVKVSTRELAKIEGDQANSTLETLGRVFRPFGFKIGLLPMAGRGIDVMAATLTEAEYSAFLEAARTAVRRHSKPRK